MWRFEGNDEKKKQKFKDYQKITLRRRCRDAMRDDIQKLLPSLFDTYFTLNDDSKRRIHFSILFPSERNFHSWQLHNLKIRAIEICNSIQRLRQHFEEDSDLAAQKIARQLQSDRPRA